MRASIDHRHRLSSGAAQQLHVAERWRASRPARSTGLSGLIPPSRPDRRHTGRITTGRSRWHDNTPPSRHKHPHKGGGCGGVRGIGFQPEEEEERFRTADGRCVTGRTAGTDPYGAEKWGRRYIGLPPGAGRLTFPGRASDRRAIYDSEPQPPAVQVVNILQVDKLSAIKATAKFTLVLPCRLPRAVPYRRAPRRRRWDAGTVTGLRRVRFPSAGAGPFPC